MRITTLQPLFAWEALEDSPSLQTVRDLLAGIPDHTLLESLRRARGKGRDDYPVSVLWGTLVLTIALRHAGIESCLGELSRNKALRNLIGIESEEQVPKKWNMSRFLAVLGQEPHLTLLHKVFNGMTRRLGEVVVDLGRDTAGDASGLNARPTPGVEKKTEPQTPPRKKNKDGSKSKPAEDAALPEPAGGRKEYTDDDGKVTKIVEWFGYKFHLLVDVKHEVALAYQISSTKDGDNEVLPALLQEAQANLPEGRMKTLAYDKAADDHKVHRLLHGAKIAPLIQNRALWKDQTEQMLPGHNGHSNIVYDENGTVHCYDKVSDPPVRHQMSYIGHEPQRGTLKYRCPARHEGWTCPSEKVCNAGKSYGLTVRVKQEIDLRRFPPIPRATKQFERKYKGRTAVERVNARVKIFWGADDGNITGARRFHAHLGVVMVVHAGFATALASAPHRFRSYRGLGMEQGWAMRCPSAECGLRVRGVGLCSCPWPQIRWFHRGVGD